MPRSAVLTFTARGSNRIIREGGSQSWRLNVERTKRTEFLVCTQNTHNGPWGGMDHSHRTAFLVGRISGVVPSTDTPGRWLIQISEFARVNLSEVWKGWRFPVRYTSLEELGIDLDTLAFEPLPPRSSAQDAPSEEDEADEEVPPPGIIRSVADAKRVLAGMLGVPEANIDITVRY